MQINIHAGMITELAELHDSDVIRLIVAVNQALLLVNIYATFRAL